MKRREAVVERSDQVGSATETGGRVDDAYDPAGAYRMLRASTPSEAPAPGYLARFEDETCVLVEVDRLHSWAGWRYAGAEHVWAPRDIVRLKDTHAVVLPVRVQRLDAWIAAREGAVGWEGGEIVTLVVSLLRGVQETYTGLPPAAGAPEGTWWLTDGARPVFVHGDGGPPEHSAREVIEAVRAHHTERHLARVLESVHAALAHPRRLSRESRALEAALFEAHAPRELRRVAVVTSRAEDGRPREGHVRVLSPMPERIRSEGGTLAWMERFVDARLAEFVRDGIDELRSTWRAWRASTRAAAERGGARKPEAAPRRARSRLPLVGVAIVTAATVMVCGMLWGAGEAPVPQAETADRAADDPDSRGAGHGAEDAGASPAPTETSRPGASPQPRDLGVSSRPDPELTTATARELVGGEAGEPEWVEDFGDVAVMRVEVDGVSRHAVFERGADGWRLRQLYDTAEAFTDE